MAHTKTAKRRRPARTARAFKRRPLLEQLEDRTLPANGLWLAIFSGLPAATNIPDQILEGKQLLHSAGLIDDNVQVVNAGSSVDKRKVSDSTLP